MTTSPLPLKKKMDSSSAIPYILVSVVAGAAGQLLLKHGMNQIGRMSLSVEAMLAALTNPGVWFVALGLFIYVCGTAFWLIALSRADLSFAYPFASLSYVAMLVGSWLFFGENISWLRIVGSGVIITGVLIIAQSYRS